MFENTSLLYLCTILEAIEKIEIYKHNFESGTALMEANDQMNFNAICRLLLAVGEESKKMDANLLALQPQIDWNAIIDCETEWLMIIEALMLISFLILLQRNYLP